MLDLDTVLASFPAESEESHETALRSELAGRGAAQVTPYQGTATRPLQGAGTVAFPFRSV